MVRKDVEDIMLIAFTVFALLLVSLALLTSITSIINGNDVPAIEGFGGSDKDSTTQITSLVFEQDLTYKLTWNYDGTAENVFDYEIFDGDIIEAISSGDTVSVGIGAALNGEVVKYEGAVYKIEQSSWYFPGLSQPSW